MLFDLQRALASQGKALGPHPAFMDPSTPVSVYVPGGGGTGRSLVTQRQAGHHAQAYGGNEAIDWVYDCINLYADAASSADFKLVKKDGTKLVRQTGKDTPDDYEIGPKALYDLLDQPNPYMLYDEMVKLLVIDLMLVGNGYWFKWRSDNTGKPLAIYRLAPSAVRIRKDDNGFPVAIEYQPPGVREKLLIPYTDVIHFKRPNPHDPIYGMGVIQGAGRSMDLELSITDTIASYYENKADPSLIIESERRVPRDVFHKLRAQIRARAAGSNRAGELLVLESGLQAKSLSASASDALFADLSGMSQSRIYTKFRAHRALFGGDMIGTDKVSDVRREFDNSALRPFLKSLSTQISFALADAWDCKYAIDHRSTLPAEDIVKVVAAIAPLPGIKIRELRRQLEPFGIEESTGDPDIDNFILNKPGPEMDANGNVVDPITGKVTPGGNINAADQPIGSEPGRPPKASNTKGFGTAGGKSLLDMPAYQKLIELTGNPSDPDYDGSAEVDVGKALSHISEMLGQLEGKAVSTPAPDNSLPGEIRPGDPYAKARAAEINSLQKLMQDRLASAAGTLERALLDEIEIGGKALKTSDLVYRIRNADAWRVFRKTVQADLRDGMMRAASSSVMSSGLDPAEDIDYEALADEVLARKGGLNGIVKNLKDKVVTRVKDARADDAERHEFNSAIQEAINEWSTGQASVVAATEAVEAYNEATLTASELSGVTQVFVTDGDDSDEPCQSADGQIWDISHARENRTEHPNCRRAFLPLTAAPSVS